MSLILLLHFLMCCCVSGLFMGFGLKGYRKLKFCDSEEKLVWSNPRTSTEPCFE